MTYKIKICYCSYAAEWWVLYGQDAPSLKKIASRVLAQTCSASGCERNWSTFNLIHSKRRNRLGSQRLNDLVFVHYNMRLRVQNMFFDKEDDTPLELANIFQLDSEEEDPLVEWVRDRGVPVMDEPGGMPDSHLATQLDADVDEFLASEEGRVHTRSPVPFDPPAGTDTEDPEWSWSGSGASGSDHGGGGRATFVDIGADPEPRASPVRYTGESQYTHATQDDDHAARAPSSSRRPSSYSRRPRHHTHSHHDEDADCSSTMDADVDSLSSGLRGLGVEENSSFYSGHEQWNFPGYSTGSTYTSNDYIDMDFVPHPTTTAYGSSFDDGSDAGANTRSHTGSTNFYSTPSVLPPDSTHQSTTSEVFPCFPKIGILRTATDVIFMNHVQDYQNYFASRMSWEDYVAQLEDNLRRQLSQMYDDSRMDHPRHSTYY